MLIILTGLPGSGKSTIGKKIAKKLNYEFLDLDYHIERNHNNSISEIFHEYGESYFRKLETSALKQIIENNPDNMILSLGGGTFINDQNKIICLNNGVTVWLNTNIDLIVSRIKNSNKRPLLKQGNPRDNIKSLFKQRKNHYQQAKLEIKIHRGMKYNNIVNLIIEKIDIT